MRSLAAILLLTSCHWAAGGFGRSGPSRGDDDGEMSYEPECREVPRPAAQAVATKPGDAHPDFAKLGAYRSYFRVTKVGDYVDHFALFFNCVEASIAVYGVAADGTATYESGGFGGIGIRSGEPRAVPDDKRGLAGKALAQLATDTVGASGPVVKYLGQYREVTVEEIVPVTGPGDPYKRMTWYQRAIVPMNEDESAIVGRPGLEGGETLLCWRDVHMLDCTDPRWMDFTIAAIGAPQLAALLSEGSPAAPADRTRFAAAIEAAAKGAPAISTDDLLARQGTGLLPPGFSTPLRAGFTIRGTSGAPIELRVPLLTAEIAHGHAEGTVNARFDRRSLSLTVIAEPETPITTAGAAKLRVHFRYQLVDGLGTKRTGDVIDDVEVTVDGDAAAIWSLGLSAESNQHGQEAPIVQTLPAAAGGEALRGDFGVSWNVEPWYPK